MRRGELRYADLEPAHGSEADKVRPVVVVSNNGANAAAAARGRGVVTIVPLTSNVSRVFDFQVLVPAGACGLPKDSKVQTEQVRSIDVSRLGPPVGALPPSLVVEVERALRLHLGL
jgi:mRNA interferase MazF